MQIHYLQCMLQPLEGLKNGTLYPKKASALCCYPRFHTYSLTNCQQCNWNSWHNLIRIGSLLSSAIKLSSLETRVARAGWAACSICASCLGEGTSRGRGRGRDSGTGNASAHYQLRTNYAIHGKEDERRARFPTHKVCDIVSTHPAGRRVGWNPCCML